MDLVHDDPFDDDAANQHVPGRGRDGRRRAAGAEDGVAPEAHLRHEQRQHHGERQQRRNADRRAGSGVVRGARQSSPPPSCSPSSPCDAPVALE